MAIQTKVIKEKIKGVGNIKKITKTMEMVSAAKMKKAVDSSVNSKKYSINALETLVNITEDREVSNPLINKRKEGKTLIVIFSSNKGLSGAYSINLSRHVSRFIKDRPNITHEVIAIGKQSEKIAKRNNLNVTRTFNRFKDFSNLEDVDVVMDLIIDEFLDDDKGYRNIYIAHTHFIKMMNYKTNIELFLPAQTDSLKLLLGLDEIDKRSKQQKPYTFEPNTDIILEKLIPTLLRTILHQVFLDSFASEHSSRMIAMKNASENAEELQDELKLTYNKARQAAVTQEISEISSGANALS
jgi:F-type H+-transporting ATPase subunit gamma